MGYYKIAKSDLIDIANAIEEKGGNVPRPLNGGDFADCVRALRASADDSMLFSPYITSVVDSQCTIVRQAAFSLCENLEYADFETCSIVSTTAFASCHNLIQVNLPNVKTIGVQAFRNCSKLESLIINNCECICGGAFASCVNLSIASAPNLLSLSGSSVFYECTNLQTIDIGNVSEIPIMTFSGCTKLQNINMPGVRTIRTSAFYNCYALQSVELPNCTQMDTWAFYNCQNLSYINIPLLTQIPIGCFSNNYKLSEIHLDACTKISTCAFAYCGLISSANFPKVTELENDAFSRCTSLSYVSFPNLKSISGNPFSSTSFQLNQIDELGYGYFENSYINAILKIPYISSKIITNIYNSSATVLTDFVAENNSAIRTVAVPNCQIVGAYAFRGCSNLQMIDVENCKQIGLSAFTNCSKLQSIRLSHVQLISQSAFQSCYSLGTVIIDTDAIPSLYSFVFNSTPMTNSAYLGHFGSIYVRASLVEQFKMASNWISYANRIVPFYESEIYAFSINSSVYSMYNNQNWYDWIMCSDFNTDNFQILNLSNYGGSNVFVVGRLNDSIVTEYIQCIACFDDTMFNKMPIIQNQQYTTTVILSRGD